MASLRLRSNGIWEIQFTNEYQKKKTITLSSRKYKQRTAQQLQDAVRILISKKINNDPTPDRVTKTWVKNATPEIQKKLAKFDLWTPPVEYSLGELWEKFIDQKSDKSEGTQKAYNTVKDRFLEYFDQKKSIEIVTKEVILEWKRHLFEVKNYAEATVKGTLVKTKAAFDWAKEQGWITKNPLDKVETGSYRNLENDRIITLEEFGKLLDACPDQEWRVIITLARVGGLRPCEIANLRWCNIDWKNNRFQVYSPKLKQHEKWYKREVPLFTEISVELEKLREVQGNGLPEYIINCCTDRTNANMVNDFTPIA